MPSALGGIVTGTTLAVARAAGETAPLLFTCSIFGQVVNTNPSLPVASVPVIIFEYSEAPDKNLNAQAWAAAFVLIVFVLVTTLISRMALERSRRKLGPGAVGTVIVGSPLRHLPVTPFAHLAWRLLGRLTRVTRNTPGQGEHFMKRKMGGLALLARARGRARGLWLPQARSTRRRC